MEPEQLPLTWRDAAEAMIKGAKNTLPTTGMYIEEIDGVMHTCAIGALLHTWAQPFIDPPDCIALDSIPESHIIAFNELQTKHTERFGRLGIVETNDRLGRDVVIEQIKVLLEENS